MKKIVFLVFVSFLVIFSLGVASATPITQNLMGNYGNITGEPNEQPMFDAGDGLIVFNNQEKGMATIIPFEEYSTSNQEQNFVWKDIIGLGDVNIAESSIGQNGAVSISHFIGFNFHDFVFSFIPMTLEILGQTGFMTIEGYDNVYSFSAHGNTFGTSVLTNFVAQPVPEPTTMLLFGTGGLILVRYTRKKQRTKYSNLTNTVIT